MSFVAAIKSAGVVWMLGALPPTVPGPLTVYRVDPGVSSIYVVTHRAGLFSFLGHEHAIVPSTWSADLCLADPVPQGAHGSLAIDASSLLVDSDSARQVAGLGGGPSADDRREIQAKMLDSDHLDAEAFPVIRLGLHVADTPDEDRFVAEGTLDLHGVTNQVRVPVTVARAEDGSLTLSGVLRIRQRDFGIEPESRAGVVKVSNDVDLHFSLVAHATETPCAAGGA
jgi:YceI-like domain